MVITDRHRTMRLRAVGLGAVAALVAVVALAGCSSDPGSDTVPASGTTHQASGPAQGAEPDAAAGPSSRGDLALPEGMPDAIPVVDGRIVDSGGGAARWGMTIDVDDAVAAATSLRSGFVDAGFEIREWKNEYGAVDGRYRSSYGYVTSGDIGVVVKVDDNEELTLSRGSDATFDPDGWHVTYQGASPDAWAKAWNPDHGGDDGAAAPTAPGR